jgi:solute carrier family 25 (mitochondrial adenine nucleotide translocator), member 4/5/6/31
MTATPDSPSPSLVIHSTTAGTTPTSHPPPHARPKHQGRPIRAAVAGACAGALAKTIVAPIERVKILMQLQHSLTSTTYLNKNPFQVASTIYRDEGVLAFWRGNFHNVLQQGGTSALNFMFMDYYKALAGNSVYASFLCGGLAGGTATTLLYPIQFLRTRLAADVGTTGHRSYPHGMRDVLRATLRVDGIVGLYQGYGIALAGIFLYRSLHMGGYDAIKTVAKTELTWTDKFAAAQFVSLVAGTICYPIDSVRRRLMMQAGKEVKLYRHSIHAFQSIFRQEGIRGFYRGLGPNLVRSFGAALLLVSYDAIQSGSRSIA